MFRSEPNLPHRQELDSEARIVEDQQSHHSIAIHDQDRSPHPSSRFSSNQPLRATGFFKPKDRSLDHIGTTLAAITLGAAMTNIYLLIAKPFANSDSNSNAMATMTSLVILLSISRLSLKGLKWHYENIQDEEDKRSEINLTILPSPPAVTHQFEP